MPGAPKAHHPSLGTRPPVVHPTPVRASSGQPVTINVLFGGYKPRRNVPRNVAVAPAVPVVFFCSLGLGSDCDLLLTFCLRLAVGVAVARRPRRSGEPDAGCGVPGIIYLIPENWRTVSLYCLMFTRRVEACVAPNGTDMEG